MAPAPGYGLSAPPARLGHTAVRPYYVEDKQIRSLHLSSPADIHMIPIRESLRQQTPFSLEAFPLQR